MATELLHPAELAYAFSYARPETVIGWGLEPFLPQATADADPQTWLARGEERLVASGRLVGTPDAGLDFSAGMEAAVLALVNPAIVLLAQRRAGEGVRTLTVHARGADFVGLMRRGDGNFEMTRYDGATAAAGACAAFAGATTDPAGPGQRIAPDRETLAALRDLAAGGRTDRVEAILAGLGTPPPQARSAALALAAPAAAGVTSVLGCAGNAVEEAESYAVLTNAMGETWIVHSPAGPNGPAVLERSSTADLAARIGVRIAVRQLAAG